jgi:hypothetical protein
MLKDIYTVIYYTSNREDPVFEQKVRDDIQSKIGDLPLVSVSQKPINFGKNICIGDVGASEKNLFRQVVTACLYATTPYVIITEADCLYPKEYFNPQFDMDIEGRHFLQNVWIHYPNAGKFFYKGISDCAKICGRVHFIDLLMKHIEDKPVPKHTEIKILSTFPIINIKTGHGLRPKTQVSTISEFSLEYWGTADYIKERMGL